MLRTLRGIPLLGCLLGSVGCHGQPPAPPTIPMGDYNAITRQVNGLSASGYSFKRTHPPLSF